MPKRPLPVSAATYLILALLVAIIKTDCPLTRYPKQTTVGNHRHYSGYVQAAIDYTPTNQYAPQVY